jgi:molybdate transport system regulatory protein
MEHKMAETRHQFRGRLEVQTEVGAFLGDTRIRLLEQIAQHGSISQAAKFVPLSYKAAWDAVEVMNNLADEPLVTRAVGGKNGGGTQLTDYGHRVVALYRALESEYQAALERLMANMNEGDAGSFAQFRRLLKRMSMKTSARNQFVGNITALIAGEVNYEVRLKLDDANELTAVITRESAETLGLVIGMEVYALVKSSSVLLLTDREARTTASNHLWGQITRIHEGPVSAEIILALPGGKSVCSVISHDSVGRLGLAVEAEACAVFQASSVILCLQQ